MRLLRSMQANLLLCLAVLPQAAAAQFKGGEGFLGAASGEGILAVNAPPASPDSSLYADGTRAINEGRWQDAEAIFAKIADQRGDHAAGALYWQAYAQSRRGQAKAALGTCAKLRADFAKSRWNEECDVLGVEIGGLKKLPAQALKSDEPDYLSLLELARTMKTDEPTALSQIADILQSDASKRLKDGALYVLGQRRSSAIYPQIARLRAVEGDVRVARGNADKKAPAWEQAVAGLPLETGYSLATGDGRAEIELEDASIVYLAPNSALAFNDLHTIVGIPNTEIALLTGTVTLNVRPYVYGENFVIKTPSDSFATKFPDRCHARVTSYLDAMAVTWLENGVLRLPGVGQQAMVPGQTLYFSDNEPVAAPSQQPAADFSAWDQWVAERVAQRHAEMAEMMKASGLQKPIPGLAEMRGQGRFFDCAPYGTCWEPEAAVEAGGSEMESAPDRSPAASDKSQPDAQAARTRKPTTTAPGSSQDRRWSEWAAWFPCLPESVRALYLRDRALGVAANKHFDAAVDPYNLPYSWAVCHTGSWIRHGNHYAWVVSHRRHHHEPCHWVKTGHQVALVPTHPRDGKGQRPVNAKDEVLLVNAKNGFSLERGRIAPEEPVELLKEAPREFRAEFVRSLAAAEDPHLTARSILHPEDPRNTPAKPGTVAGSVPLTFDHRSQSFMVEHSVAQGGKTTTVMTPVSSGFSNLQMHASSYGGNSAHGGGSSGGGSSGGSSHGGGSTSSSGSTSSVSSAGAATVSTSTSTSSSASSGSHK